jgi:mannobiose 2-epimerase
MGGIEAVPAAALPFTRSAALHELHRIADWWMRQTPDPVRGGFVGQVDSQGRRLEEANRGVILNSRILWFFSALARFEERPGYRETAGRALSCLLERFDDPRFGGAVWEVAADGALVNGKKQVYALAFCIHAFAAWFRLTADPHALRKAQDYLELIETHARDTANGGYREAFSRDWQALEDVRLGADDPNAPRSMNSHLHLLEAFTALHHAAPSARTEEALRHAIGLMCSRIFDAGRGHLSPFFDERWRPLSPLISFGHDIEASWLLWEAAGALGDEPTRQQVRPVVGQLAQNCLQRGIGADGQLCESLDPTTQTRLETGVWWVQAEALVGFLNARELTGDARFRHAADGVWRFIVKHLLASSGEWHWQYPPAAPAHYRAGFWKGPYHNGRAMLEACRRFEALGES